ncbi:MAG: alpha-amylase family glycosyl hydrolase [Candidatus Promineifilaceae bacterium]
MDVEVSILREHLTYLYGQEIAEPALVRLLKLLERFARERFAPKNPPCDPSDDVIRRDRVRATERDAILITYADIVQDEGIVGLKSLNTFLDRYIAGSISTVHLLPFFPFSSDDGFSVIDYRAVDQPLGDWSDISQIGSDYRLMFDAVINHVSSRSEWFQGFLGNVAPYHKYFIVVPEGTDLSAVFRPRALPLLTPVESSSGRKNVWSTFSADQIDLDFGNPDVLLEIIDVLLDYVSKGAEFIRLDAIAYLWKEPGTSCIHLPQTHRVIQLFRSVLDMVAPGVSLITETNVPHKDNVSYFGDGNNEAQLVYNFTLPPLLLHTFHCGQATALSEWADSLSAPSDQTTFFNFTASHDGIGVLPARDLLGKDAFEAMASHIESLGGYVSYKSNPDGSRSPYELNMNYLDALGPLGHVQESSELISKRFLASQAIMLALKGLPGIYFHSLVGSRGWNEGAEASGRPRTINREKLDRKNLEEELSNSSSLRHHVFHGYIRLLKCRAGISAFDPFGDQQVLKINQSLFAVLRTRKGDSSRVLCLHNVSPKKRRITLGTEAIGFDQASYIRDVVSGREFRPNSTGRFDLTFDPYDFFWLVAA